MGYFEFLNGWRIICLPFEYFRKIVLLTCLRKARTSRDSSLSSFLIRYNTHAPWKTTPTRKQTGGNHHHFFIRIPILGHVLVHSGDKSHVLVVTVELIWLMFLNIFSSNFFPTLNNLWTNHYQNCTAFLLDLRCLKWQCSFFSLLLVSNDSKCV